MAAFMLLIELIERIRSPGAAMLALTMEAFAIEETPGTSPSGVGIPAALAFLGLSFAGCALIIAGLPPLSGFVAKFGLFHALLNPDLPDAGSRPVDLDPDGADRAVGPGRHHFADALRRADLLGLRRRRAAAPADHRSRADRPAAAARAWR